MINDLMHLLQRLPPYGLSGLFMVRASFLILSGLSLGVPLRTEPQLPHLALPGFLLA